MHDVEVDGSQSTVFVSLRDGPDDRKAMALPQRHRAMVGTDDSIELHGLEAPGPGFFQRVLAHPASDPATRRGGKDHVAGIGHVGSEAWKVHPQAIGPDELTILLGDVYRNRSIHP